MNNKIIIPKIIEFDNIGSSDIGYITVAEYDQNIPFEIKRVYWTYYTPNNISRGKHAHIRLEIILIAAAGKITVKTESVDGLKNKFVLDSPDKGLYIPPLYWHTMVYTHNAVQVCIASRKFTESHYIRNYQKFKQLKL